MGPLMDASKKLADRGHEMSFWREREDQTATATCRRCGLSATTSVGEGHHLLAGPAAGTVCHGQRRPDAVPDEDALSEER